MRITKKQLIKEAEKEEAFYFTGNVYSYENIIFYLEQLAWRTKRGIKTANKERIKEIEKKLYENINKNYITSLQEIIKNIKTTKHDSYKIEQIYYSAGVYGNSGQLHAIKLYNKENITALYYCYY